MAIHAPDEETMNLEILRNTAILRMSVKITSKLHTASIRVRMDMSHDPCRICDADMSQYIQEMYDHYESDEDWGVTDEKGFV